MGRTWNLNGSVGGLTESLINDADLPAVVIASYLGTDVFLMAK